MEYRKLISFGKNSYVVSLPKSWIRQHKLNKGDLINIDERGNNLLLGFKEDKEVEERVKSIIVDGKSIRRIQREIISAYIKDYKSIILSGEELKDKAKEIQNTIQNLMALEVMEQTSKRLVARDFLDMNSISIFNLVRKVDVILRAMIEDCEQMFEGDNCENISHRDNDVNRLSFLVFRIVEFGLNNPSFMYKKHNLTSQNLLNLWWFVFNLEAIGDEVKRIARYMKEINLDNKEQERFKQILAEAKEGYLKVMKGFHNQNEDLAHHVLESKSGIIEKCEKFYQDNRKADYSGLLGERIKSLITNVHNLGRVVYQYGFTEE